MRLCLMGVLLAVSCDNETDEDQHPPSLKKVSLSARSISEDIKTFIESGKAKVVLTITTDEYGKTPAAYYTGVTTEGETQKSLIKVTFLIEKEGSIDQLFLEASKTGNTYYIQQFDFYKQAVSQSNRPDYVIGKVKPFTLKTEGDNQVTLPIILNKTKTKGSTTLPSLKVGFRTMFYDYFTKSSNIDLTIRYTKSGKTYTIINQQNVFNSKQATIEEDKWLKIRLNNEEDLYKGVTFTVEAKVHDYPSLGAVHDFIMPSDVNKQIRSGKLVLKMNNHLPSTKARKNILIVDNFLTTAESKINVKSKGGITTQDIDKDGLSVQYTYEILYRSKRPFRGMTHSQEPSFDKALSETLRKQCPNCIKSDSQGNTSIIIGELRSYFTGMVQKYYPFSTIYRRFTFFHPLYLTDWIFLRAPDFALRLSVETNDGLQWTARKELLNIYFE